MQLRQKETKLRENAGEVMSTPSTKRSMTGSNDTDKSASLHSSEDGLDRQSTDFSFLLNPQQSMDGFFNYWNDDLEADVLDAVGFADLQQYAQKENTKEQTTAEEDFIVALSGKVNEESKMELREISTSETEDSISPLRTMLELSGEVKQFLNYWNDDLKADASSNSSLSREQSESQIKDHTNEIISSLVHPKDTDDDQADNFIESWDDRAEKNDAKSSIVSVRTSPRQLPRHAQQPRTKNPQRPAMKRPQRPPVRDSQHFIMNRPQRPVAHHPQHLSESHPQRHANRLKEMTDENEKENEEEKDNKREGEREEETEAKV